MNSDELLRVEDLVVEYSSGKSVIHAVNGVSFVLKKGKTLGLVGETGAGKTTIAKAIIRILPDPPAKVRRGDIFYEGEQLFHLSEKKMKKIRGDRISMIFQDPMTALNPIFTVGDQIAETIRVHDKISKKESFRRMMELLEMVGIPAGVPAEPASGRRADDCAGCDHPGAGAETDEGSAGSVEDLYAHDHT